MALGVKKLPANAGDIRDSGSIPESERSPGGGHGNPFQYPYLENPTNRGTWQAIVHGIAKSWTGLSNFHDHNVTTYMCTSAHSVVSKSWKAYGLWPARLLCPWDSPGKNTGVGCCALLQGIFPAQGSNPCLLHLLQCRQILYC